MVETTVDLIVNKNLTAEQFAALLESGEIGENELSFVDDGNSPYKGDDGLTTSITVGDTTYTVDDDGNIDLGDLATTDYIDSLVGDFDAFLDALNGEVI